MSEWYYILEGTVQGPLSPADMRHVFDCGALPHFTKVWSKTLDDWVSAECVPEFVASNNDSPSVSDSHQVERPPQSTSGPSCLAGSIAPAKHPQVSASEVSVTSTQSALAASESQESPAGRAPLDTNPVRTAFAHQPIVCGSVGLVAIAFSIQLLLKSDGPRATASGQSAAREMPGVSEGSKLKSIGKVPVRVVQNGEPLYTLDGRRILNEPLLYAGPFADGVAKVWTKRGWGYINSQGKFVESPPSTVGRPEMQPEEVVAQISASRIITGEKADSIERSVAGITSMTGWRANIFTDGPPTRTKAEAMILRLSEQMTFQIKD
jgi:hypothetical protein